MCSHQKGPEGPAAQELRGGGQGPSALFWDPFHISSSLNNMAWASGQCQVLQESL